MINKLAEEQYGGPLPLPIEQQVAQVTECVDLTVAFSPVLEKPGDKDPVEVERREDGSFWLVFRNALCPSAAAYERVSEKDLRVMRARYIITKNDIYRRARSMPAEEARRAFRAFYPDGILLPAEGSEFAKLLGMENSHGVLDRGPQR